RRRECEAGKPLKFNSLERRAAERLKNSGYFQRAKWNTSSRSHLPGSANNRSTRCCRESRTACLRTSAESRRRDGRAQVRPTAERLRVCCSRAPNGNLPSMTSVELIIPHEFSVQGLSRADRQIGVRLMDR